MATASKAMQASNTARKRLVELHQDEFNRLLREERERAGLPGNPEQAKLQARKEKLEKQLAQVNEQLNG